MCVVLVYLVNIPSRKCLGSRLGKVNHNINIQTNLYDLVLLTSQNHQITDIEPNLKSWILQTYMNQFFAAIDVHIDEKCILDVTEQAEAPFLASLGIDNTVYRLNVENGQEERFVIDQQMTFDAMALAPDASHCLIGGKNNAVLQFNFADSTTTKLFEAMGNITALKYAPTGKYFAIGSEEGKAIIYDPNTGRKEKCRPGHTGSIYTLTLSRSANFLASIGADQLALIYRVSETQQPIEVTRYPITKLERCTDLTCSFNFIGNALYVSGAPQLQKIECIENRWDYTKSKSILHSSEIIMVQAVKQNTLVTSTYQQFCVWSIKQEEKLFQIEQFCLTRVVPIAGKFYGSYNNGKIYEYKREIRQEEPMDIEHESQNSRIEFAEEPQAENEDNQQEEEVEVQREIQYRQHKKTKAEKMITCFPQPPISTATQLYNENRFLFVNSYGCVIQRHEGDEEKFIEVELEGVNKKQMKFILGMNKDYTIFSMNQLGVIYAGQKEFGFRPSTETNNEQWRIQWAGVEALAMGSGWIAAANVTNNSEIKIFDMASHEIRTITFDRQLVAMRAFQNVLAVVYHESVPLWDSQQLSMQLYIIDSHMRRTSMIANTHVPLTPKSLLRWFDFSSEGMIFSQDSIGIIRAFSLQTSEWTTVSVDNIEEIRKVWLIGIKNHQSNYWKTTDTDPEPTVAPRFQMKTSEFSIPTVGGHPEETQEIYQKLLWRRYILDHQKARTRLWGHLKITRQRNNMFYKLSESILTQKRIAQMHFELDQKYFPLIERYLKLKQNLRAFLMAQNCIRSLEFSRRLVELFDFENQRSLAIQFEEHCDQREKQADYEQMQIFQFMKLREEAERCIKPRSEDPMKRGVNRKTESIPTFSQSFMSSQQSVDNSIDRLNMSRMTVNSQISQNSQNQDADNPFLKRKSTHETIEIKKKEIYDQIKQFAVKQKADKRNIQRPVNK